MKECELASSWRTHPPIECISRSGLMTRTVLISWPSRPSFRSTRRITALCLTEMRSSLSW